MLKCLKIRNVGLDAKIYSGRHEGFLWKKLLQEEIIVSFSVNSEFDLHWQNTSCHLASEKPMPVEESQTVITRALFEPQELSLSST